MIGPDTGQLLQNGERKMATHACQHCPIAVGKHIKIGEVTDAVIDGPQSIVFPEAENRLHTAKAIMACTMRERPF